MSFRNWLLASTSIAVLALAPISVSRAQDANNPQLRAAFTAYQADQSDENRQKLDELCRGAGFQGLDDCIAALTGLAPADQAPADQPAAAAPASASEDQAAPPPPAPSEAAAPVASSSEQPPPPPPAPKNEAPAAQPAPAPSAPAPSSEAAPAAPAAAAPAATPASAPAGNGVLKKLEAAVNAYNSGIADLIAGKKNAQREIDRAKEQIDKICASGGFADTDTCLAQFSLTLSPLPAGAPAQPAASSAEPQAPSSAPEVSPSAVSASQEPSSSVPPVSELPKASEEVTPSAVEVLPSDVSSEAAPILDSAKDQQNSSSAPASSSVAPDQSSAASSVEPPPAQPAGPPPKDDKAAQQDIQPPPPADLSTQTDKGKPKPPDFIFVQPTPPADNPDVKVVQKPKNDQGGLIFQIGINIYISNPEQERNRFYDPNHGDKVFYEDLSFGRTRETILRRDGTKIVTIYARDGDVLQRSKILPNGHEIVLASADPRERDNDSWEDPGRNLPPLVLNIPAKDYILDADGADQDQIDFFLDQPPVEKVRQIYTIDDVKRSARLRDSVRRLEIGGLTFDMGKATISRDQVGSLAKVAKAMTDLLAKNPGEVFLIEGHTDAVGSDVSNLVLSDQRASTVARILTDFYEIPAENLVTQGYGERYLKVKTDGPEPLNRRVTIKRITPLVAYGN